MPSAPWFDRLRSGRITPEVLTAGQKCLDGMTATIPVAAESDDPRSRLVHQALVPWPALHASIEADLQRARERLKA